jgi:hypothetical protein
MNVFDKEFNLSLDLIDIGGWVFTKYRAQQTKVGTYQAARNMRKQGFPLALARLVLL